MKTKRHHNRQEVLDRQWERSGTFNKHHLTNRCRGGKNTAANLLQLDINRHKSWHLLFGNNSLEEIILILQRLKFIKEKKGAT